MTGKKLIFALSFIFLVTFFIGASGVPVRTLAAPPNAPKLVPTPVSEQGEAPTDAAIRSAFQSAAAGNRNQVLGLNIYDPVVESIHYSKDSVTALLWIAMLDQQTHEVIAAEPGMAIARRNPTLLASEPASWAITFQSVPDWFDQMRNLPQDLLTDEIRVQINENKTNLAQPQLAQTFTGYKLPWAGGLQKRLTGSIGHFLIYNSCSQANCRYAYDFADGTMFPLVASKGGTVIAYRISCANGDENCTNYLTLKDESTSPTTYQLYYHIAYNSIPQRLRTIGTQVLQGEYIGDVDDTGYSTGHHLHFHVFTSPTSANYYWGPSVKITFDDVATNAGEPRTCYEAMSFSSYGTQCNAGPDGKRGTGDDDWYRSGNTPAHPPSGSLDLPVNRETLNSRTIWVQGRATDDIEISRVQVMVDYDGSWKSAGDVPTGSGTFGGDVDLCSAGVPDGPLALTVRIFDREGSQAPGIPIRQLIKNFSCEGSPEPPAPVVCNPSANQVALYADTDYRGTCKVFDLNNTQGYTSGQLGALGENNAASVRVGSNVRAILYDRSADVTASQPAGRLETIEVSDTSLVNNRIGADSVSGLWVVDRSIVKEVVMNPIGNRLDSSSPSSVDSLILSWKGGFGATSFSVKLDGPSGSKTATLTNTNSYPVGSLAAGSYTFSVTATSTGAASKTSSIPFTVSSASLVAPAAKTVPYQENMESGASDWKATGLWRLGSFTFNGRTATNAWGWEKKDTADYNDATWRAGDLTSPPIAIPASGVSYLRFAYYMDTEDGYPYWDQRWVQVSVDGSPFANLYQLVDDKQSGTSWFNSGPVSLEKFVGKTIRLRFHMDTIDGTNNTGKGWIIDDVSVTTLGPDTSCADNDSRPASAQAILVGSPISAMICPEGDVDYYKITGTAGQPVIADLDARTLSPASKLDSYIYMLDSGLNPIAENDDEKYGVLQDSKLTYTIQRDGTYYLKVKAWNHPGVGSKDFPYNLTLIGGTPQPPRDVQILYPPASDKAPRTTFTIEVAAVDVDGGPVAQVDFYWHGPDWNKSWVKLGTDADGSNGWSYPVDPAAYGGLRGSALYVQALSRTKGVKGVAMWDMVPGPAVPVSSLDPLPAQIGSTVFRFWWSASDADNDIDHFELQYQENSGAGWSAWKDWVDPYHSMPIPSSARSAWFTGVGGNSYNLRLRAVDRAGNVEAWSGQPETTTKLSKACTADADETRGQTPGTAIRLPADGYSNTLNLCKADTGAGDVDWFIIHADAGQEMTLMAWPGGGGTAFTISVRDPSNQVLYTAQSTDYEEALAAHWKVLAAGDYFISVSPLHDDMYGTEMYYQIWSGKGSAAFLPRISR